MAADTDQQIFAAGQAQTSLADNAYLYPGVWGKQILKHIL